MAAMRNTLLLLSLWLPAAGCSPPPEPTPEELLAEGREDAQKLVAAIVPEIEELLAGERFTPIARAMLIDGAVKPVAPEEDGGGDPVILLQSLQKVLKDQVAAGGLKATALAYRDTATLSEAGRLSDAVAIDIDHRGGYSVTLLFPYNLADGVVRWKAPQAQPGRHKFFAR